MSKNKNKKTGDRKIENKQLDQIVGGGAKEILGANGDAKPSSKKLAEKQTQTKAQKAKY